MSRTCECVELIFSRAGKIRVFLADCSLGLRKYDLFQFLIVLIRQGCFKAADAAQQGKLGRPGRFFASTYSRPANNEMAVARMDMK